MTEAVYLCRGWGFGHAARALPVLKALRAKMPDLPLHVASSTGGVSYLRKHGYPCENLEWTDRADHSRAAMRTVQRYLKNFAGKLTVVVSDELAYVPLMCHRMGVRSVYLTCRLGGEKGWPEIDEALTRINQEIIIPDWDFAHRVPGGIRPFVTFTGPIVATIDITRAEARKRLGIPRDEFVAVMAWGSLHPTKIRLQRKMFLTAANMWRTSRPAHGRLLVLEERSRAEHRITTEVHVEGIEFLGFRTDAHLLYRAADVVLTTGGSTALELAYNAIPAVAFSSSTRSIGWKRLRKMARWSVLAHSEGLEPDPPTELAANIDRAVDFARNRAASRLAWCSPEDIADRISREAAAVGQCDAGQALGNA